MKGWMNMFFAWWNALSTASHVFYCIAVPAPLVLLIQTVMMLIGIGDDGDGFGDALDDGSTIDIGSTADGVFGEDMVTEDYDGFGLEGLRIFTLRGIVAFFVVFGWVGIALDSAKLSPYVTLPIAFASGFVMMLLIALLFRAIMKLESSGNIDIRNALGVSGTVYLKIPAKREGQGKINVMIQGSYCERDAVTDSEEALPTGSEVVVTGLSGQNTLVVRKK